MQWSCEGERKAYDGGQKGNYEGDGDGLSGVGAQRGIGWVEDIERGRKTNREREAVGRDQREREKGKEGRRWWEGDLFNLGTTKLKGRKREEVKIYHTLFNLQWEITMHAMLLLHRPISLEEANNMRRRSKSPKNGVGGTEDRQCF